MDFIGGWLFVFGSCFECCGRGKGWVCLSVIGVEVLCSNVSIMTWVKEVAYMYRAGSARESSFFLGAYTGIVPSCPNVKSRLIAGCALYQSWYGDVLVVAWCMRLYLNMVSLAASSQCVSSSFAVWSSALTASIIVRLRRSAMPLS